MKTVMLLVLTLTLAPSGTSAPQEIETQIYEGFALAMGAVATGTNARVQITIDRLTTDEERAYLLDFLAREGSERTAEELGEQESTGRIRVNDGVGWDLRYARQVAFEGGKQIVLATDRPLGMGELIRQARTLDKGFTLIVFQVDEEGDGEGQLAVGAELRFDQENNILDIEYVSTEPMRLRNIFRWD